MKDPEKLRALLRLLDDGDNQVAVPAMAELLSYGEAIGPVTRFLQESPDPVVRRRAHQLQSILKTRARRRELAETLNGEYVDLALGLSALHSQWYDSDSDEGLSALWREHLEKAGKFRPRSSRRLAEHMADVGFAVSGQGEIEADFYCVGSVLEDRAGADFVLCAIAAVIGVSYGWRGIIVRVDDGTFCLLDANGQLISPVTWRVESLKDRSYERWTSGMVLRLDGYSLLLCAICSDSVRYVYTLGTCLAKSFGVKDIFSVLPPPYRSRRCQAETEH